MSDDTHHDPGVSRPDGEEAELLFTVATVWREERVSCPHPDLLRTWADGALAADAAEFVAFHLDESQCPYCNAVVQELRERDAAGETVDFEGLEQRLMRSTIAALREQRR